MIPIKCICSNCRTEFLKTDTRNISTALNVFCSNNCRLEFSSKNKKQIEINCLTCGKSVIKKLSEYNKFKLHFCSSECLSKRNLKENTVFCSVCKKELVRSPSLRELHKKVYCSKRCESVGRDTRTEKECPHCKKIFRQKSNKQTFCSNSCKFANSKNKSEVPCFYCKKIVMRTPYQIKLAKYTFCSKSCNGKYYSWKNDRKRRSKAEKYLVDMIKEEFPNIEIHENSREILNCHLEIDIWIPSIKLAIELNGPCHFLNIYGEKIFQRTLTNDEIKKKEILERGFNLLIININQPEKIVKPLINNQYQTVIKPSLENLLISNQSIVN